MAVGDIVARASTSLVQLIKFGLARLRGDIDTVKLMRSGLRQNRDSYWGPGLHLDPTASVLVRVPTHGSSLNVNVLTQDDSLRWHTGVSRLGETALGDTTFVGAGATLMPGVTLGARAIVAAGAVVYDDVPADTVVGGNPAKVIGSASRFVERHRELVKDAPKWTVEEWPKQPTPEERERLLAEVSAAPIAYRR